MKVVTCIAPVNIAVVKYWGKRNDVLILPINNSISATLDTSQMYAKTTIMISPNFVENTVWLNGVQESFENPRLQNCVKEIKNRICEIGDGHDLTNWNIHICSMNNFPTAAGLASSAAGYACLVFALANLYNIKGDISAIARTGSGSACRSIYGGWVEWCKGSKDDGSDSIALQLSPASHWSDMRIIILVVNESRKKHSSTSAMKKSVETSALLKMRAETIVPNRVNDMKAAIKSKNFSKFAELTMRDSNQFHAICLDTYPPCVYMNDTSHAIVELVHMYNEIKGTTRVAYTFDAGPNACLYTLEHNVDEIIALINVRFPTTSAEKYLRGIRVNEISLNEDIYEEISVSKYPPNLLKYIIITKVGEGPQVLSEDTEHLLDEAGYPKMLIT